MNKVQRLFLSFYVITYSPLCFAFHMHSFIPTPSKKKKKMARRHRYENIQSLSDADVSDGEEEAAMEKEFRKKEERKGKKRPAAELEEEEGEDFMELEAKEKSAEEERERKRLRILLAADVDGFLGFPQEIQNLIIDRVRTANAYYGKHNNAEIKSVLTTVGLTSQLLAERTRAYVSQTFHTLVRHVRTEFGRHGRGAIGVWHTLVYDLVSFLKESKLRAYPLMVRFLDRRLEFPPLTPTQLTAVVDGEAWPDQQYWQEDERLALVGALTGNVDETEKHAGVNFNVVLKSTLEELRLTRREDMHYMHFMVYFLNIIEKQKGRMNVHDLVAYSALKYTAREWLRTDAAQFFTFGGLLLASHKKYWDLFWNLMAAYTLDVVGDIPEDIVYTHRELSVFYGGTSFKRRSYNDDAFEHLGELVQAHGNHMGLFYDSTQGGYYDTKSYAAWLWMVPDIQTYAQIALDPRPNVMKIGNFRLGNDPGGAMRKQLEALATRPYGPGEVPANKRHWSDVMIHPSELEVKNLQKAYTMAQLDQWPQALRYLFEDGEYFFQLHLDMMKRLFKNKDYHDNVEHRLATYLPLDASWDTIASRLGHITPAELEEENHIALLFAHFLTLEHMDWDSLWTIPSDGNDGRYINVFDLTRHDHAQFRALLNYAASHPALVDFLIKEEEEEGGRFPPPKSERYGIMTKKLATQLFRQRFVNANEDAMKLFTAYGILDPPRFFNSSNDNNSEDVTMADFIVTMAQHGVRLWDGTTGDHISGLGVNEMAIDLLVLYKRYDIDMPDTFSWSFPRMPDYNLRCLARRWLSVWITMRMRVLIFPHDPIAENNTFTMLRLDSVPWLHFMDDVERDTGSFKAACLTLLDFCFFWERSTFKTMAAETKAALWKSYWNGDRARTPEERQWAIWLVLRTLQHEGHEIKTSSRWQSDSGERIAMKQLLPDYLIPLLSPPSVEGGGGENISWVEWLERYDVGTLLFWAPKKPENFAGLTQASFLKDLYQALRLGRYPSWNEKMPEYTASFF
jgi:hypothetical protein